MVHLLGESPNLIEDLFSEFGTWEAILNSLPDFCVDDISGLNDPPIDRPS